MPCFAVEYTYSPDQTTLRDDHRPAHREWLAGLLERGQLLASGPYIDGSGALLLYAADDESSLRALLTADPFAVAGAIADTRVTEWNPVMGPFTP